MSLLPAVKVPSQRRAYAVDLSNLSDGKLLRRVTWEFSVPARSVWRLPSGALRIQEGILWMCLDGETEPTWDDLAARADFTFEVQATRIGDQIIDGYKLDIIKYLAINRRMSEVADYLPDTPPRWTGWFHRSD